MAKYRGVTWQNAGAGPKVRVRRSIWLAELQDFGSITDAAVDLPTRGAVHRAAYGGSKSGTREFVDLSTVNDLAVVDTQDHGLISDSTTTFAAWPTVSSSSGGGAAASTASYVGPLLAADYGLDFTPSNNYLEVAQADTSGWFGDSTGWSIELWIRHTSATITTADAIIGQFGNISLTSTSGGNNVVFKGNLGLGTEYMVESSNGINDINWHHIHVGYDGTEVRMFIDGTEVGSMMNANRGSITSITVDDSNTSGDFLIGARENSSAGSTTHYWDGEMADIHITSGSASHARTANYDTDDIYAPTSTDETVLLVHGTLTGWSNSTTTTVTETGVGTAIGYDVAQPWANFGTSNVTYTAQSSAIQDSVAQMPRGVTFNNDGTMIYYVTGGAFNPCKIYGASLSTAYDITSITNLTAQTYDAATDFSNIATFSNGQVQSETNLLSVSFNPEGSKMWVLGQTYRSIIQFNLTTAWDITTASANYKAAQIVFTSASYSSGWNELAGNNNINLVNAYGLEWHEDGMAFSSTHLGQTGSTSVSTVSTAYDISTVNGNRNGAMVTTGDAGYSDMAFTTGGTWNHNGTERYTVHTKFESGVGNGLNGWDVVLVKSTASTPYDASTLSYTSICDLTDLTQTSTGPIGFKPNGVPAFSPNGRKLFVMSYAYENGSDRTDYSNPGHIYEFAIN